MSSIDDLQRQANTLAERLRRTRSATTGGAAAAIRQAHAGAETAPTAGAEYRTRLK
jgi:hypothetical protein